MSEQSKILAGINILREVLKWKVPADYFDQAAAATVAALEAHDARLIQSIKAGGSSDHVQKCSACEIPFDGRGSWVAIGNERYACEKCSAGTGMVLALTWKCARCGDGFLGCAPEGTNEWRSYKGHDAATGDDFAWDFCPACRAEDPTWAPVRSRPSAGGRIIVRDDLYEVIAAAVRLINSRFSATPSQIAFVVDGLRAISSGSGPACDIAGLADEIEPAVEYALALTSLSPSSEEHAEAISARESVAKLRRALGET